MNLADPELELIDPTPNVHAMFVHFDKMFFWTSLASRAVVRWSKRMYSCAGICSYDTQICDIALSEPLLKLRPRKDLVETLLHEMIHAYLFITKRDRDRDGHGPNFKAHMHRINNAAGLNISIYHDFHDEVNLYRTHVWRCDGPCQKIRPYFGLVRRPISRAPGPTDRWWSYHKRSCGGTFIKIKEPEKKEKVNKKENKIKQSSTTSITKFITKTGNPNINTINTFNDISNVLKPCNKTGSKINSSTVVITQKSPTNIANDTKPMPLQVFGGKGQTLMESDKKSPIDLNNTNPLQTVRSIWANKQLCNEDITEKVRSVWANKKIQGNAFKTKQSSPNLGSPKYKQNSPPMKVMKIDDYFKTKAESLLKSVYGQDMKVQVSGNQRRLSVSLENRETSGSKQESTSSRGELVGCPVCAGKYKSEVINDHLDECLNTEIIQEISADNIPASSINIVDAQNQGKTIKSENAKINQWSNVDATSREGEVIEIKEESRFGKKVGSRRKSMSTITTSNDQIIEVLEVKSNNARKRKSTDCIASIEEPNLDIKAGSSRDDTENDPKACPCCGKMVDKPLLEHLDECLSFFDNNTTIPEIGASTSFTETIVIDDEEDQFNETLTHNATGTKCPCPCCFNMIEMEEMNAHLDICLK